MDLFSGSRLDGVEDPFLLLCGSEFESALIGWLGVCVMSSSSSLFKQVQTCLRQVQTFKLRLQQERERLQGELQQQPQEQQQREREGLGRALVAF